MSKFQQLFQNGKQFCKKHKKGLIAGATVTLIGGAKVYFLVKNNADLSNQVDSLKNIIKDQKDTIETIKESLAEKEDDYKEMMSDALRNGSSLAGEKMAERRWD